MQSPSFLEYQRQLNQRQGHDNVQTLFGVEPIPCDNQIRGIRVRRDNWLSVRYAEELNSGKSSVILQRADRHGILGQKSADFQESV